MFDIGLSLSPYPAFVSKRSWESPQTSESTYYKNSFAEINLEDLKILLEQKRLCSMPPITLYSFEDGSPLQSNQYSDNKLADIDRFDHLDLEANRDHKVDKSDKNEIEKAKNTRSYNDNDNKDINDIKKLSNLPDATPNSISDNLNLSENTDCKIE